MVLSGSRRFLVVLSCSRRFSMVLCGSSRRFSQVFNGSCRISMVLSGSRSVSNQGYIVYLPLQLGINGTLYTDQNPTIFQWSVEFTPIMNKVDCW